MTLMYLEPSLITIIIISIYSWTICLDTYLRVLLKCGGLRTNARLILLRIHHLQINYALVMRAWRAITSSRWPGVAPRGTYASGGFTVLVKADSGEDIRDRSNIVLRCAEYLCIINTWRRPSLTASFRTQGFFEGPQGEIRYFPCLYITSPSICNVSSVLFEEGVFSPARTTPLPSRRTFSSSKHQLGIRVSDTGLVLAMNRGKSTRDSQ